MQETETGTQEKMSWKEALGNFKQSAQDTLDAYYKLAIATATRKVSETVSTFISAIVIGLLVTLAVVFAFVGLAFWVGSLINSIAGGFLIVAGFFALLLAIVIGLRSKVIHPLVRNSIIKKVYEKLNDDDDDDNNVR